jgi:hypothetical protein
LRAVEVAQPQVSAVLREVIWRVVAVALVQLQKSTVERTKATERAMELLHGHDAGEPTP